MISCLTPVPTHRWSTELFFCEGPNGATVPSRAERHQRRTEPSWWVFIHGETQVLNADASRDVFKARHAPLGLRFPSMLSVCLTEQSPMQGTSAADAPGTTIWLANMPATPSAQKTQGSHEFFVKRESERDDCGGTVRRSS
uniref:Uncharacterized protein n=1 Tax=Knipowitschia caucasica TaxID=637954 RepID=A0AAV2IZS6_KNICA